MSVIFHVGVFKRYKLNLRRQLFSLITGIYEFTRIMRDFPSVIRKRSLMSSVTVSRVRPRAESVIRMIIYTLFYLGLIFGSSASSRKIKFSEIPISPKTNADTVVETLQTCCIEKKELTCISVVRYERRIYNVLTFYTPTSHIVAVQVDGKKSYTEIDLLEALRIRNKVSRDHEWSIAISSQPRREYQARPARGVPRRVARTRRTNLRGRRRARRTHELRGMRIA